MKTEPTHLEQYQAVRITALETALKQAQDDLKELSRLADSAALKIRVNDPNFLEPVLDKDYEIIDKECPHYFVMSPLGSLCCNICETPKYSI